MAHEGPATHDSRINPHFACTRMQAARSQVLSPREGVGSLPARRGSLAGAGLAWPTLAWPGRPGRPAGLACHGLRVPGPPAEARSPPQLRWLRVADPGLGRHEHEAGTHALAGRALHDRA